MSFIKKNKKELHDILSLLIGVSICNDIKWSLSTTFLYETTCHWVNCKRNIKKRAIAFKVFDERHTIYNIYQLIKVVVKEYDLINKIFAIDFANAYANIASIPELEKVYKYAFGGKFFVIDVLIML